ncbi:hypothetical protein [Streptomyces sp. NRRL F-5123]|uniref:hypothetical protein n=1 Tax=Streptomyces sp. NRRL F-5123 TaxID=1463856 RepID=UPI0004E14D8B|nr:hypothetical protein [Streptomyces sp. NRRL F-5123]
MTTTRRSSKSSYAVAADEDHLRLWSCVWAVLFVPLSLGIFLLTMSSDSASDCALNGEQCHPAPPWSLFVWGAALAGAAWLTTLMASTVRGRQWALAVQVLAEFAAVTVILAHG